MPRQVVINQTYVTHELIDGEVIAINLQTGYYYSLEKTAAECWSWIDGAATVEHIAERFVTRKGAEASMVRRDVARFFGELEAEGLIALVDAPPEPAGVTDPDVVTTGAYETPVLQRYEDMHELLTLDPIHQFGEKGWPVREQQGPGA